MDALRKRHDFFHSQGCRLSDHGIEQFYADPYTDQEIEQIFRKVYEGRTLEEVEIRKFRSALLYRFSVMDWEKNWTQQFHYGPMRNNNTRMFQQLGPDTGFDSIGECQTAGAMARFLDRLDQEGKLTRTILYNIRATMPCSRP